MCHWPLADEWVILSLSGLYPGHRLLLSLVSSYFSCAPEIREPHKGNFVFLFFKCVFILMDELPSQRCNGQMKVCGSAVKLLESKLKNNSITGLRACGVSSSL